MTNRKKISAIVFLLIAQGIAIAQQTGQSFDLVGFKVNLTGDFGDFKTQISIEKIADGLEIATISLTQEKHGHSTSILIELEFTFK